MNIFKEIRALKVFLREKRRSTNSIGFVPTMGALHLGHLSLIKESKAQNDITVVSIFVNPTQFNSQTDFEKYPRILEDDLKKLENSGCDVLFIPEPTEMYPHSTQVNFDFGRLDKIMEGAFRPGHFNGVAIVVSKLFNIVEPDNAYFGQKDWQQFAIISKLTEDLSFDVQIHAIPTIRESDGLAMSSRNLRLTPEQRMLAPIFYKALSSAKEMILKKDPVEAVKASIQQLFSENKNVTLEYFEIVEQKNLQPVTQPDYKDELIICIAGWIGEVRLIDNIII